MHLIIGLGNPGKEYENTRHNLGYWVASEIARKHSATLSLKKNYKSLLAKVNIDGFAVIIAMPVTFMNNSGEAARKLADDYEVPRSKIIIVHDEMDLDEGIVKIKFGGGSAGHNGLSSITDHLKTNEYIRIRIGIGRPKNQDGAENFYANYVLSDIPKSSKKIFENSVKYAAAAAEEILISGVSKAMNAINKAA